MRSLFESFLFKGVYNKKIVLIKTFIILSKGSEYIKDLDLEPEAWLIRAVVYFYRKLSKKWKNDLHISEKVKARKISVYLAFQLGKLQKRICAENDYPKCTECR